MKRGYEFAGYKPGQIVAVVHDTEQTITLVRKTELNGPASWVLPSEVDPALDVWDKRFTRALDTPYALLDPPALQALLESMHALFGSSRTFAPDETREQETRHGR